MDGRFDLAQNGGGSVVLRFVKQGFLGSDRRLDGVPWRDYVVVDDVVLVARDSASTIVAFTPESSVQIAQASVSSDADGPRRPTVILPSGITGTLVYPDGDEEPLPEEATLRLTELTVGPRGPLAVPSLPSASQYTFAFEASLDEQGDAEHVVFDEPVLTVVENFTSMSLGPVPAGFYDRELAMWVPAEDGVVAEIHSEPGGIAELVIDESGLPADDMDLEALGITIEFREALSDLYDAGASLWLVSIGHFSIWDFNWAPDAGDPPNEPDPDPFPNPPGGCTVGGSVIGCQTQTLGESIPISGTPWSLHYESDRVPGRTAMGKLEVSLTGPTLPPRIKEVVLFVDIAGRRLTQEFNQSVRREPRPPCSRA